MNVKNIFFLFLFFLQIFQIQSQNSVLLKDIIPTNFGGSSFRYYTDFNGEVFFEVTDAFTNAKGLWKTDGTTAGTRLVKSIFAIPGRGEKYSVAGDKFFFFGNGNPSSFGIGLWVSDGTEAGTEFLKNFAINSGQFTVFNEELFFRGDDGSGFGLWKSDGTLDGTTKLADIPKPINATYYPSQLQVVGDKLFFMSGDSQDPNKLWVSDGSKNGTEVLIDFDTNSAFVQKITTYNDKFLLSIISRSGPNTVNPDLYISDGTPSGTQINSKINSGFYIFKNEIYTSIVENDSFYLSKYDPIENRIVKLIPEGLHELKIWDFAEVNDNLYLVCDLRRTPNIYQDGIWVTDGTEGGAKRIAPQKFELESKEIISFNEKIYFSGTGSGSNDKRQLWVSDGTEQGTKLLKILLEERQAEPNDFKVLNERLFFKARKSISGPYVFWVTDGTEQGTIPISGRANEILTEIGDGILFLGDSLDRNTAQRYNPFYFDTKTNKTNHIAPLNSDFTQVRSDYSWINFNDKFIYTAEHLDEFGVEPYILDLSLTTHVSELPLKEKLISVFPQPFVSDFEISLKDESLFIKEVQIFDLNGKLIVGQSFDQKNINISDFEEEGVFIMKILFSDGRVKTKKIISVKE